MSEKPSDDSASLLPPRASSPPLPPKKNAAGLPPTYLNHLRALLRQWLEQHGGTTSGLPGGDDGRLWSSQGLEEVEKSIWDGAVLGHDGLLGQDWNACIVGAVKRRKAWEAGSGKGVDRITKEGLKIAERSKNGSRNRRTGPLASAFRHRASQGQ